MTRPMPICTGIPRWCGVSRSPRCWATRDWTTTRAWKSSTPGVKRSGPSGVRLMRGAGTPVWEVDVAAGKTISAQYLPDEPGVMQGMIPEVGIWMPGVLRVDPFPAPHIVHFEWYVPVTERTHRYMISWGSKVTNEQEEKAFFDEMKISLA